MSVKKRNLIEIPIITTSIGAEGLKDSSKYMIVEDSALNFAQKIISLYDDENELKSLSEKSRKYCENNFSYDAAIKKLKEILC